MSVKKDPEAQRKAAIKAARVKQRQIGMTNDDYRTMLETHTGKSSTTELTLTELGVINNRLTNLGAVNPKGASADGRFRRAKPREDLKPLLGKLHELLKELRELNGNAEGTYTMSYADAICERNGWCSRVDFADAHILHKLVGALARTVASSRKKATKKAN